MKTQEIKFKDKSRSYSVMIGNNILDQLPNKIKKMCPKTKKVALIVDKNVPRKFKDALLKKLRRYYLISFNFSASEKTKSIKSVNYFLEKLLSKNFNRNDLIISLGGGITGDVVGFIASIYKRGINFINVPTTLLAQVDAAVGGKTGINSIHGKNLIGAFYQPKLVFSDTVFLNSLPKKQIICGYAEILKHAIIKDIAFFNWLKKNTKYIFLKRQKELTYAIKKSCKIKMSFVNEDEFEKGLRMKLNFGHTFAHAIEVKNNYSKKTTHGEAVLAGMILATRLSVVRKTCKEKILKEIQNIYLENKLNYTFSKYSKANNIIGLIPYIKNDKKNDDDKINFILLKDIGKTMKPNSQKISISYLKKYSKIIAQY